MIIENFKYLFSIKFFILIIIQFKKNYKNINNFLNLKGRKKN